MASRRRSFGGDDVLRRGSRSAHFGVGHVGQALVVRVGVHGRHEAALDPERVVQDLADRRQGVRGARGVAQRCLMTKLSFSRDLS